MLITFIPWLEIYKKMGLTVGIETILRNMQLVTTKNEYLGALGINYCQLDLTGEHVFGPFESRNFFFNLDFMTNLSFKTNEANFGSKKQ